MKKIIAIKMQYYKGMNAIWHEPKEIIIDENKVETVLQGNDDTPTHWLGQQRIVLKSSWESRQLKSKNK